MLQRHDVIHRNVTPSHVDTVNCFRLVVHVASDRMVHVTVFSNVKFSSVPLNSPWNPKVPQGPVRGPGPYCISGFWLYFSFIFVFFWLVDSCFLVPAFIYFLVLAISFPSPLPGAILSQATAESVSASGPLQTYMEAWRPCMLGGQLQVGHCAISLHFMTPGSIMAIVGGLNDTGDVVYLQVLICGRPLWCGWACPPHWTSQLIRGTLCLKATKTCPGHISLSLFLAGQPRK